MLLRRIQRPRLALRSAASQHPRLPLPLRPQLQYQHIQQRQLWGKSSNLMSWLGFKKTAPQEDITTNANADTVPSPAIVAETVDAKSKEKKSVAEQVKSVAPRQQNYNSSSASAESEPVVTNDNGAAAATTVRSEDRRLPPVTAAAGAIEIDMDASSIRDVKRAVFAFRRHVFVTKSGAQLMDMWHKIRGCQPFYIHDGVVHYYDAAAASSPLFATSPATDSENKDEEGENANPKQQIRRPQVMQLIPLDTFIELTQKAQASDIGNPSCFIGKTVSGASSGTPALENVLFLSEKNVVRQLVRAITGCKDIMVQQEVKQLFEEYEAARLVKIDELLRASPAYAELNRELLEDWTRLSKDTHAAYINILVELSDHKTVVNFFDAPAGDNIAKFLGSTQTLRKVLKSCLAENRGDLAKRIIDDFPLHFPWLVFGKNSYQMAIQASFKSRQRTLEQLHDALHVYRRMSEDAGYIVYPNIWSTLFNTCIYMKRHEEALEVFGSYATQQIAPFQQRFTQALRTACKFEQFDTAIAMIHAWIEQEKARGSNNNSATATQGSSASTTKSILENQSTKPKHSNGATASKAERECFNKVLWEMLKGEPTLDQLAQVLRLMQERRAAAGAQVIRLLVIRYLRTAAGDTTESNVVSNAPIKRLEHLLKLWEAVPNVIERNGFILHLLIDYCLVENWEDACAYLVDYGIQHKIDLPMGSIVKLLEAHERDGAFDKIAALGGKLLSELGENERARLSQGFFEVYLMSFLRAQQFAEITRLDAELHLTERFPKSDILFTVVKDAANA